jgi:hypothetical protein
MPIEAKGGVMVSMGCFSGCCGIVFEDYLRGGKQPVHPISGNAPEIIHAATKRDSEVQNHPNTLLMSLGSRPIVARVVIAKFAARYPPHLCAGANTFFPLQVVQRSE